MDLEIKKLESEISEFGKWKIRVLLGRDDINFAHEVVNQVLKITNENDLRVYLNEKLRKTDPKQFSQFYTELLLKKKRQWELLEQQQNRIRKVSTDLDQLEGLTVYKKQEEFVDTLHNKKKKSTKKSQKRRELREVNSKLKERIQCDCQASEHELIGNCLSCGKIICELEGEGPCLFCGSLKEKTVMSEKELEDFEKAVKLNEKLLLFDRENAARTSVLDDQEDHFSYQNKWLSKEEREEIKRREEELEREQEENKRKLFITIDLAGRITYQTANEVKASEAAKVEKQLAKIHLDVQHNVLERKKDKVSSGLFANPFLDSPSAPKYVKVDEKILEKAREEKKVQPSLPETLSCKVNPSSVNQKNNQNPNEKKSSSQKKISVNSKNKKARVQNDWDEVLQEFENL